MIVIKDFKNVDEEKLRNQLNTLIELKKSEELDLSFFELVTTPVYLSLNQLGDITNLALQLMMRARTKGDERIFDLANRVYEAIIPYESKMGELADRILDVEDDN